MFRTSFDLRDLEKLAESAFSAENFDSLNDLFTPRSPSPSVAYDLVKFDDHFELHVDLPGVTPETIDLTVDGKGLTLTAERSFTVPENGEMVKSGRAQGTYKKVFHLSEKLDSTGLTADYNGGVLVITIPVAATAQPQKVTINFTE